MGKEGIRQPKLHIKLLGDFRVAVDDDAITTLSAPRLQALIAYLLLHGDALQTRQHIAFLFWPEFHGGTSIRQPALPDSCPQKSIPVYRAIRLYN